jgi:hypothetical protein
MQSTLTFPKPDDDPHDVVVVAPDAVRVAPSDAAPPDDEIASLLQQAARQLAETPTRAAPDFAAAPTVPPVDTTFRPTAVDGVAVPGQRRSMARRATRAFVTLLLAAGVAAAAFAWRSQGDAAKQMIAQWMPPLVAASPSAEKPESAAPSAAPAVVQADAAALQPAPPAPQPVPAAAPSTPPAPTVTEAAAPAAVAPAPDTAQLQSMARDLASLGQEVVQLKASIEQLKAGQQQVSREAARASEQNLRARVAAVPPRPPASLPPRPRRPMAPMPPPQAAAASTLPPPVAAPYYAPPPAPPPQATEQQLTDPELASVPRPPMPVR